MSYFAFHSKHIGQEYFQNLAQGILHSRVEENYALTFHGKFTQVYHFFREIENLHFVKVVQPLRDLLLRDTIPLVQVVL